MAIRSLIAIGRVAYFSVPLAGNKLAMSTSNDELEVSIGMLADAKEGDVASLLSPLLKTKRSANI